MAVLDVLHGIAQHISTVMLATGMMHLALFLIRNARLEEQHPIKRVGEPAVSIALFPMGIIQLLTMGSYILALVVGDRVPTDPWGIGGTMAYCAAMGLGGFSGFSQLGRKFPWAVFAGTGTAIIGGGALYHFASGSGVATAPALAGSVFLGLVLYVAMFFLTLPWNDAIKTLGTATAFSPVMLGTSLAETVLGLISAMGLVIL